MAVKRSTVGVAHRYRNNALLKALFESGVESSEALLQVVLFVVLDQFLQ